MLKIFQKMSYPGNVVVLRPGAAIMIIPIALVPIRTSASKHERAEPEINVNPRLILPYKICVCLCQLIIKTT